MRNRAKCKLCNKIIESMHPSDYVMCACGEIAVDGGEALRCYAKDWNNFLRVDDEGCEIAVKVNGTSGETMSDPPNAEPSKKTSRADLVKEVRTMVDSYQNLPQHALTAPATCYDLVSVLLLLLASLEADS